MRYFFLSSRLHNTNTPAVRDSAPVFRKKYRGGGRRPEGLKFLQPPPCEAGLPLSRNVLLAGGEFWMSLGFQPLPLSRNKLLAGGELRRLEEVLRGI